MLLSSLRFIVWLTASCLAGLGLALSGMYLYLSPGLPAVQTLRDIKLQTPLRVYTADNKLIGEFGVERRSPIRYQDIPPRYIDALLAAEDERFYEHGGVSITGLMRAVSHLVQAGELKSGGSTITMQVARHFFLDKKKNFKRKFNEILLALRIEQELSKEQILELYVNVMFMGKSAYGLVAASETYYGKPVTALSLAQLATLAGLYQSPSSKNPISDPVATQHRRDWILGRMLSLGKIDSLTYQQSVQEPLGATHHQQTLEFNAPYVAEQARQQALALLGEEAMTGGYSIYTTLRSDFQAAAQTAVNQGLYDYDRRHGYRGPEKRWQGSFPAGDLALQTAFLNKQAKLQDLEPGLINGITTDQIAVLLKDGRQLNLPWSALAKGLRLFVNEDATQALPKPTQLFALGDLIRLREIAPDSWQLAQLPSAEASLVSIDAYTGEVVAMIGGFDYGRSKFDRALQAKRLPGSNFKPFLYTAALEQGFTPASLVNDAPIVYDDGHMEEAWRPENSSGDFLGPIRLRKALYLSRNLVSIRVLQEVGLKTAINSLGRFGIDPTTVPANLSLALGTYAMSPFAVATGYSVFANGGYKVQPYLIDRITDAIGGLSYQAPRSPVCHDLPCTQPVQPNSELMLGEPPSLTAAQTPELTNLPNAALTPSATPGAAMNFAPRVMDENVAFLMDSLLRDVVQRGTGTRALSLDRTDIAGKTGTTNGPTDVWFSGYGGGIATTAWIGFDEYKKLGKKEYGGSAALPIWIDYMKAALANRPENRFAQPAGVVSVRIDPETGALADFDTPDALFEFFKSEDVPQPFGDNQEGYPDGETPYDENLF